MIKQEFESLKLFKIECVMKIEYYTITSYSNLSIIKKKY